MTIDVIVTCPFCGTNSTVKVNAEDYFAWAYEGKLAQEAFPNLDPSAREMLISGICEDCQAKIFGK